MNRLKYDCCATFESHRMSTSPFQHLMDLNRYQHTNECRNEFGLIGGHNPNVAAGGWANIVDVESNLRGITYPATKCPTYDFHPSDTFQGVELHKQVTHPVIDPRTFRELPACPMPFARPVVPTGPTPDPYVCAVGGKPPTPPFIR